MPTTNEEAKEVVRILDEWMGADHSWYRQMFEEMFEKVGLTTQNYSVRQSILMMLKIFNPTYKIPEEDIRRLLNEWYTNKTVQTVTQREYVGLDYNEYVDFMDGTYSDHCNAPDDSST